MASAERLAADNAPAQAMVFRRGKLRSALAGAAPATYNRAMFLRLRLILMLFAALWLPVQAVAAQAMESCRHSQTLHAPPIDAAADDAEPAMADCPLHHGTHRHPSSTERNDHGPGCDQCGFCHLAAAGFISGPERIGALPSPARLFVAAVLTVPASNIPEPPQRPPRRSA